MAIEYLSLRDDRLPNIWHEIISTAYLDFISPIGDSYLTVCDQKENISI